MKQPNPPNDLVARFATAVSLPDGLRAEEEQKLRAELNVRSVAPEAVVQEQDSETLAAAIRGGFFLAEAFDVLYVRFERRVHTWLVRWGCEYNLAFDLVQKVLFHCLWEIQLRTYDGSKGALSGYLRTAAHNQLKSERRKKLPGFGIDTTDTVDVRPTHEEEVERDELLAQLGRVLENMSADQRALVEFVLAGRDRDEIAQVLGIPVTTVYARLNRLRDVLAELLGVERAPTTRGAPQKLKQGERGTVKGKDRAVLRVRPDATADELGAATQGAILTVQEVLKVEKVGWYLVSWEKASEPAVRVSAPDVTRGYIQAAFVGRAAAPE